MVELEKQQKRELYSIFIKSDRGIVQINIYANFDLVQEYFDALEENEEVLEWENGVFPMGQIAGVVKSCDLSEARGLNG